MTSATERLPGNGQEQVTATLRRSADWVRLLLAIHATVINLVRLDRAAHPGGVIAVSLGVLIWTFLETIAHRRSERTRLTLDPWDAVATLAVAVASGPLLGFDLFRETTFGLGGLWILVAPVSIAMHVGSVAGALTGLVIGIVSLFGALSPDPRSWSLLLILVAVPYLVGMLQRVNEEAIAERDRSVARAVALEERERLNRIVHDGVLQVLAMVAREGHELGPRGRMLAVLARKQEDQLRATLQDKQVRLGEAEPLGQDMTDLTTMLERHQSCTVTVSTMAGQVAMPTERAKELDRVITEVLSNVFKHAGVDARAWILLEQEGDQVIITVRDDGVGMTPARLQAAAEEGHLGVKESIVGRILALRGTSTLDSAPGKGTEWEFRVPLT